MSIHIIRADLSQLPFYVDFIVNTANPEPKVGNGLDKYIHEKAGPEMLAMRKQIGQISPGYIAMTNAFNLNAQKGDPCGFCCLDGWVPRRTFDRSEVLPQITCGGGRLYAQPSTTFRVHRNADYWYRNL